MARKTGIRRRAYWNSGVTTIAAIGAADTPTYDECVADFAKAQHLGGVTALPDFGAPPAFVESPEFGEDVALQVPSQASPAEAVITLSFDEEEDFHKVLSGGDRLCAVLATVAPLLIPIYTITAYGTGADAGHPSATDGKGTFRLIEGTKASALVPGGVVNDVESLTFGIGVAKRMTVFQTP